MSHIPQFLISHGGLFLFLIVLADQSGLPVPAQPWLLAAGALAAGGKLSLVASIAWAAAGSLTGDTIWFYVGQRGKGRILRMFSGLQTVRPSGHERITTRLILRGMRILTVAKFVPFGTVVPLRAGAMSRSPARFFLIDAFSSLLYVSVYAVLGFLLHNQLEEVVAFVRKMGVIALVLLLGGVGAYLGYVIHKMNRRTCI